MAYLERLGAAALIGGAVTAVAAGPTAAETLRDAFLDAYANNPVLNQQRAQQRSVDEQVPQAKLGLRPTVGVTLSGVYIGPTTARASCPPRSATPAPAR